MSEQLTACGTCVYGVPPNTWLLSIMYDSNNTCTCKCPAKTTSRFVPWTGEIKRNPVRCRDANPDGHCPHWEALDWPTAQVELGEYWVALEDVPKGEFGWFECRQAPTQAGAPLYRNADGELCTADGTLLSTSARL